MSEDAGIKPGTVSTLALAARRSNHSTRSHDITMVVHKDIYTVSRKKKIESLALEMLCIGDANGYEINRSKFN